MSLSSASAAPVPASTLLLIRDGHEGLEVFMIGRNQQTERFGGALVFPGGKVDAEDRLSTYRQVCRGASCWSDEALALRVALLREVYEECGLLLAYPSGSADLLTEGGSYRQAGTESLLALLTRLDLQLATDMPLRIGHWVTPEGALKRFDTHFFVVAAPGAVDVCHDGQEAVNSLWARPDELLDGAEQGRWDIVFPTRCHLALLAQFQTVAAAMSSLASAAVVTVSPRIRHLPDAIELTIPADAGYPLWRQILPVSKS